MPRTTPLRREFSAFQRVSVRWADVDIYGHVNNAAYYAYVDSAVNGWLMGTVGEDLRLLTSIGIVAETSCQYLSEIDFPADVEVGLALERVGTSSVVYCFAVFVVGEESARATGRFVHVYVDRVQRRPTAIPEVVRAAVSSLPMHPCGEPSKSGEAGS